MRTLHLITLVCGTCPDDETHEPPMVTIREGSKPGLCERCGDENWLYAFAEPDGDAA